MSGTLISTEIAEPYTQALMSLAQSSNLTDSFGELCRSLSDLMENSPEFSEFIANPVIKAEDKKAVLRRVMGDESNPYFINFLMLLVDKRRIVFLEAIVKQYLTLLRELNQTVLAEVTSAQELNDQQKQAITERVKAMTDARDVELKATTDPSLIGGVIIKVGSKVIDASIRGQLRQVRMSLTKVK
jgi:F-type H+-transporting ATPase subunit delta